MPRFPKPWSKKRGERLLGSESGGVASEVAFYAILFLIGVFGLSLVLINRFAPVEISLPSPALSTSLSEWIFGVLSVAAIATGGISVILRLMNIGASSELRNFLAERAERAAAIEMIAPASEDGPSLPNVPRGKSLTDSPGEHLTYRLPPEPSGNGIAGPATLALLWNAVWFVLLAVVVSGYYHSQPRWILAGLLVPFAAIGVWSFRFFFTQLRQQAGVGPTIVEISNHPLAPGDHYRLYVAQMGRLQLKRLTVQLTCEEETFYRQGTDVRVERHEAFTQVLEKVLDVTVDPKQPWQQQLEFTLPDNVMHSFVGTHNAIRWKIVVRGETVPWPSFCRNFPVVVHPPGLLPKRSPR